MWNRRRGIDEGRRKSRWKARGKVMGIGGSGGEKTSRWQER